MIAVTIDAEWSPPHVLDDTLELLAEFGISATLFSTHDDERAIRGHERALHPNFFRDGEDRDILRELHSLYPDARGLRSHGMYVHSRLRELYPEFGIQYESNYLRYGADGIEPFYMPDGTLQVPVYWMDDQWLTVKASDSFDVDGLVCGDGLKVFDFHPPHICYNTPTYEYYQEHKDAYWDDSTSIERVRSDRFGVRDVFLGVLRYVEETDVATTTLGEIDERCDGVNRTEVLGRS